MAIAASSMERSVNQAFDEALRQTAFRLLQLASLHETGQLLPGDEEFREEEYLTYYVLSPDGEPHWTAADAPPQFDPRLVPEGLSTTDGRRAFRHTSAATGLAVVTVERTNYRRQTVRQSVIGLMLPLLALLPIMGFGSWYAIRVAMRPVASLSGAIAHRSGRNLSPLPVSSQPRELEPIALSINSLLDRLRAALDAERAFAATSAHELRTPIAGALAQTQLLARELTSGPSSERIRSIETALKKLGSLAERLLQLARLDAGFAYAEQPNDVLPALRLVVNGFAPRNVVLNAAAQEVLAPITLDAFAIAARNLIENALVHGDSDYPVMVVAGPGPSIAVVNAGPVVPPATLEEIARPFVRGPTMGSGTGIGLSIVRSIVDQSQGTLTLRSPASGRSGGFAATIAWDVTP